MLPALPVLLALVVMVPLLSVRLGVVSRMVPALPPVSEELAIIPPLETTSELPVVVSSMFPALPVRLLGRPKKSSGGRAEVLISLPFVTVSVRAWSITLPAFPCPMVLAEMIEPLSTVTD